MKLLDLKIGIGFMKLSILVIIISFKTLLANENFKGGESFFEIDQSCDSYIWKSESLGKIKLKSVELLVQEVQEKMDYHFNDLIKMYGSGISVLNHFNEWGKIKKRSPKIGIFCERNTEFLGQARFYENKIILSNMNKDSNYLSAVTDSVLFHEIYHYISGKHGDSVLDYTVLCTAGRFGFDSYLNSVGNLKPASEANRKVMLKLCATGGIEDLISFEHYENVLKLGMISYTPDLWLKSVNKVFCQNKTKKIPYTCELVNELLTQDPMKAQFVPNLEELHLRYVLENNNTKLMLELNKTSSLDVLGQPSESLKNLIKKLSHRNRQLLVEKLFHINFDGSNLIISEQGEKYCQRYELEFSKVEGSFFPRTSKISNSWCHSGKKVVILPGEKFMVELFHAGEYLGKYYLF